MKITKKDLNSKEEFKSFLYAFTRTKTEASVRVKESFSGKEKLYLHYSTVYPECLSNYVECSKIFQNYL